MANMPVHDILPIIITWRKVTYSNAPYVSRYTRYSDQTPISIIQMHQTQLSKYNIYRVDHNYSFQCCVVQTFIITFMHESENKK